MKRIAGFFILCALVYACKKETKPSMKLPEVIGINSAFDSMNLAYNTFYRMAINIAEGAEMDSNSAIMFHRYDSVTEYVTRQDTLGLHLVDSVKYKMPRAYSEYQVADDAFYQTSVGYVRIDYYPLGGDSSQFFLRTGLVKDTFVMNVGAQVRRPVGSGLLKGRVKDGQKAVITFFQ
jgi:hypothetical protein